MAASETKPDYENLEVLQRHRLPTRAYWIPETAVLLNGEWDFNYAASPLEAPEVGSQGIQSEGEVAHGWTRINVPGHWQLQGHGKPHYTNVIYPFPVCPPDIPTENPTGTYKRRFVVPRGWDVDAQLRLRFDGVDSAYHVWVNGQLVGYSQGSRNGAEFDVSQAARRDGENELIVQVYQWCEGSYIEDQDQWWLSGIFRDVHLLAFPGATRIDDFFVKTDLDEKYQDATLQVEVSVFQSQGQTLSFTLRDGSNKVATAQRELTAEDSTVKVDIPVRDPRKWTAETPYLYQLEIALVAGDDRIQTITQRVGFRKVEIKKGILTVNGRRVLLRGTNRHDHHPRFGRAVPLDFMREDLLLMKRHNINALRSSHYPGHPRLFDMADELGLWVMDEADLECHGFYDAVARPLNIPEAMDYEARKELTFGQAAKYTSDNAAWRAAYVDRMAQLVQRDKNHASIIIWSLGNEAFYGANHAAMYAYAKDADPGRPVHYEGDTKAQTADMYSYMYPSMERLADWVETAGVRDDGSFDKPVVLCEYGHAMGNGPGWLEDYQAMFRKYPRLQGGFIWEWANHGLWKADGGFYGYGGDFGDEPNDATFVMDGLCNSEHQPTPGLTELKKVIQPVRFEWEDGKIYITNEYDHSGLRDLVATYRIEALGEESTLLKSGVLDFPELAPWSRDELTLPFDLGDFQHGSDEIFLTIQFSVSAPLSWAETGHEVAWWQHKISSGTPAPAPVPREVSSTNTEPRPLTVANPTRATCTVSGDGAVFTFDRVRGVLASWTTAGGRALLEADPRTRAAVAPCFWRAPTDNDRPEDWPYWQHFGVDALTSQLRSWTVREVDEGVVVEAHTYVAPPILGWGYDVRTTYTMTTSTNAGAPTLAVRTRVKPRGPAPTHIPRLGLDLRLPRALASARWLGLGPGESYPDKRGAARMGVWAASVDDGLATAYDVPQENGNRMATRWLRLGTDGSGDNAVGLRVTTTTPAPGPGPETGLPAFSWTATRHSPRALEQARHPCDLVAEPATLLTLAHRVAGVGSAACGPGVREDLKVVVGEEEEFEFVLESTTA